MDFSVVIATFNRKDLLRRVLDALESQTLDRSKFEIVVVDDGSSDGTVQVLESFPLVRFFSQSNRGPAAARNAALAHARAAWVVMTDDDTIPAPTWLESVAEALRRNPEWIGVEGRTVCPDPDPLGHWVENLRGRQFITANMAYRKDLLLSLGGLDESFPHPKCEDTELAWRCLKSGQVGFWPTMEVLHPNRSQTLYSILRSARYELSEFRLHRKLGKDYGKFRRFGNPWAMLALIYLVVPWARAWRFRKQLSGKRGLIYIAIHLLRPWWFLFYWIRAGGRG